MAFDSKYALNDAIRYLTKVAERRAAGGWVPPKERERQQRDAMRQEQQQARQAEKQQQAQQKQFISDEKERQKNLAAFQKGNHPDIPQVVYHGTGIGHDGDFRAPSFFTSDPQGAEWYAKNRGENPQIFPVHLSMKKPLDTRSKEGIFKLINIAHNAGVHVELKESPNGWQFTSNDIAKHSPYEGDNPLDLLYIPKVRNALYQNGHDGVIASDVLSNDEIPTFIPLHPQQIKSAIGNQGTFNPSASDITKSEGGPILSKQFPTQYMPNVGRQVMADGGDVGGDTATFKGRKFWSGIFDSHDGAIREVHPYHRAKAVDFHHSHYVSPHLQDAMRQGDAGFFWVDKGGKVNTLWRDDEAPKHIVDAIHGQIDVIGKAHGGEIGRQVMNAGGTPDQPQRQLSPMGFYSAAAERASTLQPSGDAVQMVNALKNTQGIKTEELQNAGLIDESGNVHPDWAGRGKVTRDELMSHLQGQMPQVEETVLGGETPRIKELKNQMSQMAENDPRYFNLEQELLFEQTNSGTKYKNYTLPGGENYREVLLKLPKQSKLNKNESAELAEMRQREPLGQIRSDEVKRFQQLIDKERDAPQQFKSQHWDDPNVLAHIRMSDRIGPNGEKILHVEELQSDWGQKGKKEGFVDQNRITPEEEIEYAKLQNIDRRDRTESQQNRLDELLAKEEKQHGTVPSAPYVTSTEGWTDLALKRVLKEAAEGGYDKIVWTPGAEQAKRYDLSEKIGQVVAHPTPDGRIEFEANSPDMSSVVYRGIHKPEELDNIVGREVADKIRSQIEFPKQMEGYHVVNKISGNTSALFPTMEEAKNNFSMYPERMKKDLEIRETNKKTKGKPVTLNGLDLAIGGEGMKGYYDSIVPKRLQNLAKKHDKNARLGYTETHHRGKASNAPMSYTLPSLDVTPTMRKSIMRGQSAYKRGGTVSKKHPALSIAGTHIREETHGKPIFTGRL